MSKSDLHTKADRRESTREKTYRLIDLEKAYDIVNREVFWRVLRMCDVGGKLSIGIKSMYVDRFSLCQSKWGVRVSNSG